MKLLTGSKPLVPPSWGRKVKAWVKVLVVVEIIACVWSPVLFLRQLDGVGAILAGRSKAMKYAMMERKYGDTITEFAHGVDSFKGVGVYFSESLQDFVGLFKG